MEALLAIANLVLPDAIALIKEKFAKANPDKPVPTPEQLHAAVLTWLAGTLAKDDAIIAGG